jgi:hypothetical protein
MNFKYHWLHITTGRTGIGELLFTSRLEFLESLNKWNRLGENWKYWECTVVPK